MCVICPISFVVPSEAAMGEHVRLKVSLSQPHAFTALNNWTVPSKRSEITRRHRADSVHM